MKAQEVEGFEINDRDIISITESIIARGQGNYATVDNIAKEVSSKFGDDDTVGVIFPILRRNRLFNCLHGIAKGVKKIVLMLSYTAYEIANQLGEVEELDEQEINPITDIITEKE